MPATTPDGARARPWRFLRGLSAPTAEQQRAMALECAQARVLHRVALLRGPQIPPPIHERLQALHIRIRVPVPASRLVPTAHALCQDDPEGVLCQASVAWLERMVEQRPALQSMLRDAQRSLARWQRARSDLVQHNLKLALSIVLRRFGRVPMAHEDLFQESVFGLAKAADRFDTTLGVKFSTYATWWIRHSIQRAIVNTQRLVRIPAHMCDELFRFNRATHDLGDDADDERIAAHAQITVKHVRMLRQLRLSQIPVSLDPMVALGDEGDSLIDHLAAPSAEPDLPIHESDRDSLVHRLLRDLPERSRSIMTRRYGFDGAEATLRQVGAELDLSRERVRQIQTKTLTTLAVSAARAQCPTSQC